MLANINICIYKEEVERIAMQNNNPAFPKANIIFIGDCNDINYINALGASAASLFNPSFDAMQMLLNGNTQGFIDAYYYYLCNEPSVNDYILMIIRNSIIKNIPVILYINHTESELYLNAFLDFLRQYYGLSVGNPYQRVNGYIDDNAFQTILQTMYLNNMVTNQEFLAFNRTPYNCLNPNVNNKLMIENQQANQNIVAKRYKEKQENKKKNAGSPLIYNDNI